MQYIVLKSAQIFPVALNYLIFIGICKPPAAKGEQEVWLSCWFVGRWAPGLLSGKSVVEVVFCESLGAVGVVVGQSAEDADLE